MLIILKTSFFFNENGTNKKIKIKSFLITDKNM